MRRAEEALLRGLKISPNHPSIAQPLAWLYQKQKKQAAAEKLLVAMLAQYPDDIEGRYRLGSVYRDTNRPDAAIEQFREILKRNPKEAEAHNQTGILYGAQGRSAEARKEFEAALALAPGNETTARTSRKWRPRRKPSASG